MDELIDTDEYGEVINSDRTYKGLAVFLLAQKSIIVGWTDGLYTHLDVLISLRPIQFGGLRGGQCGATDLFVGVRGFGCYGFKADETETHEGYKDEKLGGNLGDTTSKKLAELINGIRKCL